MAATAPLVHNTSPLTMLGCILETIAVERLIAVTEALLLVSIRRMQRIPGFEQPLNMEIGVAEAQESVLKVGRPPCVGGDIIDGSDSTIKVPSKSTVTSSEVGECKDAGSDDEDDDDEEDEADEDDLGDEEDDLSADEAGQDDKENNPDEDEEGEEEANGNEEEDEDDDDDDDEDGEDEDDEDDEDDDDEDEDEEPPAKKKK